MIVTFRLQCSGPGAKNGLGGVGGFFGKCFGVSEMGIIFWCCHRGRRRVLDSARRGVRERLSGGPERLRLLTTYDLRRGALQAVQPGTEGMRKRLFVGDPDRRIFGCPCSWRTRRAILISAITISLAADAAGRKTITRSESIIYCSEIPQSMESMEQTGTSPGLVG